MLHARNATRTSSEPKHPYLEPTLQRKATSKHSTTSRRTTSVIGGGFAAKGAGTQPTTLCLVFHRPVPHMLHRIELQTCKDTAIALSFRFRGQGLGVDGSTFAESKQMFCYPGSKGEGTRRRVPSNVLAQKFKLLPRNSKWSGGTSTRSSKADCIWASACHDH